MKIVQLTAIDASQQRLLRTLNTKTIEEGIEVHSVAKEYDDAELMRKDGIIFHDVHFDRKISPISNLKTIFSLVKVFKIINPTIVHVHTPIAAVLGRIAAKIAKVPVIIYTAHGFYFHEGMSEKQYKLFFNIEKYIGRFFTDYIFTQSFEDYELAKKHKFLKHKNKDNYLWISNGIDLEEKFNYDKINQEKINKLKEELKVSEDEIVVSFIGRLVEEKGIFDLLDAMNLTKSKVKLIIIGSSHVSERDKVAAERLKEFENRADIIFTGHVTNAEDYLYLSDIFCLPSYREGMPRSIIEAMSMKNAILATNIRGSREEVVHEETGYLIDVKSPAEIAKYIDYLNENFTLLNEMKEKSYQRCFQLYNEKDVVEKQINVFKKYINYKG